VNEEPATKGDVDRAVTTLRQEMATKQDLEQAVTTLRQEMATKQDLEVVRTDLEALRTSTKQDLEQVVSQAVIMLRKEMGELKTALRGEMGELKTALRGEMGDLRKEMSIMTDEIVRQFRIEGAEIANTMVEQLRAQVNVVEEKYQDLPPSHAKLREDFDAHASDTRIHARVPGSLPRRARRPRSS
jgi:hypothetical protein